MCSEISPVGSGVASLKASVDALKWITGVNLTISLALFGAFLSWALIQ